MGIGGGIGIGIDLQVKLVDNFRRKNVLAVLGPDNLNTSLKYNLMINVEKWRERVIFMRLEGTNKGKEISRLRGYFPFVDIYVSQHCLQNYLLDGKGGRIEV